MMPAWHHSEYLIAICPVTESTIKKTIYSNAGSSLEWPGLIPGLFIATVGLSWLYTVTNVS